MPLPFLLLLRPPHLRCAWEAPSFGAQARARHCYAEGSTSAALSAAVSSPPHRQAQLHSTLAASMFAWMGQELPMLRIPSPRLRSAREAPSCGAQARACRCYAEGSTTATLSAAVSSPPHLQAQLHSTLAASVSAGGGQELPVLLASPAEARDVVEDNVGPAKGAGPR